MGEIKEVVLVGGGGFACEIADYLLHDEKHSGGPRPIGFVEDFEKAPELDRLPHLGKLKDVAPNPNIGFIVTSGTARFREESIEMVRSHGGRLATLIHSRALVSSDAAIGEGSIICPYAIVNSRARVGVGVAINVHASVGHGAEVGDFSVLSPYAALNGWSRIGARCFLGTRATVFPNVKLGDKCMVDSHAYAKANVGDKMIVTVRGQYSVIANRLEK